MSDNIVNLLKPIQKEGQIRNDGDKDNSIGVKHTYCSTFILEKHLLVKGEVNNPKSETRTAMVDFHDALTGEIIGKDVLIDPLLQFIVTLLILSPRKVHQ
jgi:hypothetical protein